MKPLHPAKIGVWCAVSRRKVIGTIEETVNAERYQDMQFFALLEVSERD
jgi:hypothetical protein